MECKYYFIDIQDYNRCFVAIRKVFVRLRKDYNDIEEKVRPLLKKKYEMVRPNIKKKRFRPEARSIFYFLDRRLPMDLVMYKVIELNEIMRNKQAKKDPILQTKNREMLTFTSGMRHQCTLVRNLMFSYLYNLSKLKVIYVSFNTFFSEFDEFDKNHKNEYQHAKEVTGDEDFNDTQGIRVVEFVENEEEKEGEEKEKEKKKDSNSNTIEVSEEDEEHIKDPNEESEDADSNEEEEEDSKDNSNDVVLPEHQGKRKFKSNC